jgi:hypothetical protein
MRTPLGMLALDHDHLGSPSRSSEGSRRRAWEMTPVTCAWEWWCNPPIQPTKGRTDRPALRFSEVRYRLLDIAAGNPAPGQARRAAQRPTPCTARFRLRMIRRDRYGPIA